MEISHYIQSCFKISIRSVKDTTPPTITNCPAHVNDSVPLGSASGGVKVLWLEPEATDDTGATPLGQMTHRPGETFPIGDTSVSYVFTDTSGNQGFCNFTVAVDEIGEWKETWVSTWSGGTS